MIVPGVQALVGYIGSTFDTIITVYPSADANFNWTGAWTSSQTYNIGDVVIWTDNNAYEAIKGNVNITPVGGAAGNWSATPITPQNLNGYSGTIVISPVAANEFTAAPTLTTPVIIQGLQGTMGIKFSPTQTGTMVPGVLHYYINIVDPLANNYYYLNGTFTWDSP